MDKTAIALCTCIVILYLLDAAIFQWRVFRWRNQHAIRSLFAFSIARGSASCTNYTIGKIEQSAQSRRRVTTPTTINATGRLYYLYNAPTGG